MAYGTALPERLCMRWGWVWAVVVAWVGCAGGLRGAEGDNWPEKVVAPAGSAAYSNGPDQAPKPVWPPAGQPVRVDVTADDWFSACPGETMGNAGQATKLKLKGQQEYFIFKADSAGLKGKVVTGALLHTNCSSPDWPFRRVGVSTVAAAWKEGSATEAYTAVDGAPCYLQAEYKKRDWAFPGSTVMDVVLGRGHTIWAFADCTPPDKDNWQAVAVDPRVVRSNVAGISDGYFVYDEVGNEWSDTGNKFTWSIYPNRFCQSLQQNKTVAPWLEVWVNGEDKEAPGAVKFSKVVTAGMPGGEALVSWIVPEDKGGAGVIGFEVAYFNKPGQELAMPRYLVPTAGVAGSECRMHIQDLPFEPGQQLSLAIRAVDGAGNVSAPFNRLITLSATPKVFPIAKDTLAPFPASETLVQAGAIKVSVIDTLDKVDPVSGEMIPAQPKGYLGGNHLFSAAQKLVRLQAGRNETVSFQIAMNGAAPAIQVEFALEGEDKIKTSLYEFGYVQAGKRALPDPLLPCSGATSIPSKTGQVQPQGQQWHGLIAEAYIPHTATPGVKKGTLTIDVGGQKLTLNVELTVWNFTLPNTLSFIPEMNCYTSRLSPAQWHRLAHENRTSINQLWYGWACNVGLPLKWNGNDFEWTEFDAQVGPMLDGSLFAGCPRDKEPMPVMYLPFSESWPAKLMPHFKGSFWADEAFDEAYVGEMKKAYAAFAKHADQKGWHHTLFQFFLNNKVYYRNEGANTKSVVAPWIFDEPNNTQDFWAIRWYGLIFHQAVDAVRGKAKMIYRADISYSQFGRNINWGVLDWECYGGGSEQKARQKQDEWALWGKTYFSEYGSANKVEDANIQPVAWCLTSWTRGSSAVLPWLTYGEAKSWKEADQTCLFYPEDKGATAVASVRLKGFLRGQQDVEYLTILADCNGQIRAPVAEGLKAAIDLSSKVHKTSETDAGTIQFQGASPTALWNLRVRVGKMLDAKKPAYKAALVDWSMPATDMQKLPDIGYVPVAPEVPSYKPASDSFKLR